MLNLRHIQEAMVRIRDSIFVSPFVYSETFSQLTGNTAFFKLDNLQMTGSFKERGALNKILLLTAEEKQRGVIAASAGNHAQAVAYSATRGYGADVILVGANYDETCDAALKRCAEQDLTFIHPFDDEAVIAGQGTLGLEMLEQQSGLDAVLVPIGGGGLIAGVACAFKETNPGIQVIGVQTSKLPSMKAAREHNGIVTVPTAKTIADGIAVRTAGTLTFPMVQKYVDDIVVVDEEEIASAILLLLEKEKTLTEGAGATATAAALHKKIPHRGKKLGIVNSGGNIDVTLLSRIIERGLVKDGRLVRLRIHLPDHPGALVRLSTVIADQKANIIQTSHDRAYYGAVLGDTVIDVTMETRGPDHIADLTAALEAANYLSERVQ